MATKTPLPNENAWMNITKTHIEDLGRLNWLIRNIFASPYAVENLRTLAIIPEKNRSQVPYAVENLRKLAIIPEKKLDALLKLVDVVVNDDGTMNVGRFLVKPIPRGTQIMESIKGEIVNIVPVDRTAGKTRRRRRKKGKGTKRR